ncbi:MAG: 30S ribosomal protein S20 [Candidatus Omnitrophota bacterium]|jgi:small subunit ribosomal protein S20
MPRRRTSLKAQRKDKKRRLRNLKISRDIKKAIKQFNAYLLAKNATEAKAFLSSVFSKLDKAAKKGIIKKNNAARKKSRLSRRLSKIAQSNK